MLKKEETVSEKIETLVHEVLYQKYRPKTFKEVIGQVEFVNMLQTAIAQNKIANCFIFSGPHGIGKTTLARIFAKSINCLSSKNGDACEQCEVCIDIDNNKTLDIVEIDAASNNGVDNVRDIIENANYLPSRLKYKVFIIDEAHMITTGGWNAFLKTLENPNERVIFIFATTEINKIPKTILSRCQIYNLFSLSLNELLQLLNMVLESEKVIMQEDAKLILCELANGSARDLLSMLEQLLIYDSNEVKLQTIEKIFSLTNKKKQFLLLQNIINNNINESIFLLNELNDKGINLFLLMSNIFNLSVEWYMYLSGINKNNIKPSNLNLFKDTNANLEHLTKFITKLQDVLNEIKKNTNQLMVFYAFIIEFISSNNENKKEDFNNLENKTELGNNFQITNKKEDKDRNEFNFNEEEKKDSYLDSFIINKETSNKTFEEKNNDFFENAKKRIANLDESWKNIAAPFSINEISNLNDVTNTLIKPESKKIENIVTSSDFPTEVPSIVTIDQTHYLLFAKYQMNSDEMKKNIKSFKEMFKTLKNESHTKYFLLQEALELIQKVVLVNQNFMVFVASNKFNADKFNELVQNEELLKEVNDLCNNPFYLRAYTLDDLTNDDTLTKTMTVDVKKYNDYIEQLKKITKTENQYEELTKKMLFKED